MQTHPHFSPYNSAGTDVFNETQIDGLTQFRDDAAAYSETLTALDTDELWSGGPVKTPRNAPPWLTGSTELAAVPSNYWDQLANQRPAMAGGWQRLIEELDVAARDVRAFRARIVPTSIRFLAVLALLVIVAMVIPAAYLTARTGPSKPLLLAGFSGLLLAIVGYLMFEVAVIRQKADLRQF